MIVKWVSSLFDYHLLALRVSSLLAMIAAYGCWFKIYERAFGRDIRFLLCIFAFAGSHYIVHYACEFKPYSMDVLIMGVFCGFFMQQGQWKSGVPGARLWAWIILLPFTLLFSYASLFLAWIPAYHLLVGSIKDRALRPFCAVYSALCVLLFAFVYFFDLRHSLGDSFLMYYWDSYFIQTDSLYHGVESFWEGIRRLSTKWFGKGKFFMRWSSFLIPLFIYSISRYGFRAWGRDRFQVFRLGSVAAVLLLELFVVALLRKYPFTGARITLFLAPLVFYLVAQGMYDLRRWRGLYYLALGNFFALLASSYVYTFILYLRHYRVHWGG
jgi:hypothetical protein